MRPLLISLLLFFNISSNHAFQADIIDDLAAQFRAGNAKEIAKNFASSVELIIIDQEDVYSKAQSEQILKDFFVKNPPGKISIIHRLSTSQNYRLGIFSLSTKNGKFRVTVTLNKKPGNIFLITELRIEQDKE
ncbi:MAG: DUF4783 domain-containing protein [Pedobacter sp.]|nr:DUF4783 domain-containing protein [Pedobacter sp.]MDQ8053815.1 DUF4783 domain-containing protein [Pedobacter sp.]